MASRSPGSAARITVFDNGFRAGRKAARMEILSLLEKKYMDPETRPERDSVEGNAILALAREVSAELTQEWMDRLPDGN